MIAVQDIEPQDAPSGQPVDLSICPCCERKASDVAVRYRNTAYQDERLNWLTSCGECYARDYNFYAELWADYYSSCF